MGFCEQYGPWALITGASAGLGAEFARQIAAKGLHLVLIARRQERLQTVAQKIQQSSPVQTRIIAQDLTEPNACERISEAVADLEIGLLINNAGFGIHGPYHTLTPGRQIQMTVLNCVVPVDLTNRFLPSMMARKRGGIIFLASTAAYQPCPTFATYGATKAFNLMLGEALWKECRARNVDVLALSPGFTHTEFSEVANIGQAGALRQATADQVVAHGLRQLGRRGSTVHGWINKLSVFGVRLLPRRLIAVLAHAALQTRTQPS